MNLSLTWQKLTHKTLITNIIEEQTSSEVCSFYFVCIENPIFRQSGQNYNYNVTSYSKEKGTEESVSEIESPSILHFATHGFVKEANDGSVMSQTGLIMSYGARAWEGRDIPQGAKDGI